MLTGTTWPLWFDNFSLVSKEVLTSTIFTSLLASLAGAFGGAWAAKRIAETVKFRDELIKEIRNTNAAVSMLYGIANAHLGMKRQHIKRLRDEYLEAQKQLNLFLSAKKAGTVPPKQTYNFQADMQILKPMYSPMEEVQKLIFNEISSSGQILFIAPIMIAARQSLHESLLERNEIIDEWKANPPQDFAAAYFGLPQGTTVDVRYQNIIEAIYSQNDDVIAFSIMIADALHEHAIAQRDRFRRRFGTDGAPNVDKFQLQSVLAELLPPAAEYDGFSKMFSKRNEHKPSHWVRGFWQKRNRQSN